MHTEKKIQRSCGTHDGTFHADEVTACALLILFDLIDADKICRTRDLHKLAQCEFVCDVGGIYDSSQKLFDHHQVDYQGLLSSAGMILQYLKESKVISPNEYTFFNDSLVKGVDAHDNGRDPQILGLCSYSHIISTFAPFPHDTDAADLEEGFFEALRFSLEHLTRMQRRYRYIQACRETVQEVMLAHKDCLIFEKAIPWLDVFFELDGLHHPAQFVIMPAGKHWKLRAIPPTFQEKMQVRSPLPAEWAGLLDEELKKASGISGAIFCHKGRFISVWETKQDALRALEYVRGAKV